VEGEQVSPGVIVAGDRSELARPLGEDTDLEGVAWIGRDVKIGAGVRLMGPLVLGDGASIGDRAQVRGSIVFPGTEIAAESILIDAIAGHSGILASVRRSTPSYDAPPPSEAERS
jgi:mannose-1-phosphate guanylyltransferase/mannose-1-phosphate guanylyltransferase/phosphomannomutase